MTLPIRIDATVEIGRGSATVSNVVASEFPATTRQIDWISKNLPDADDQQAYALDRALTAWTELIGELMEKKGLSQSDLAEKLGWSPSQMSRNLGGEQNLTLRSLAKILWALGYETVDPSKAVGPLGVVEVANQDAVNWGTGPTETGEQVTVVKLSISQNG